MRGLTGVRKVGVPRGRLFPSELCLSAISRVVWVWPDPLPTGPVEWGWKKCTDPMVGGARSITLYDACTPSSELELGSFSVWKWSSQVQVALGKMADFGERKENCHFSGMAA